MTEIESFVKKLKIKDYAMYYGNLEITVVMNDGRKTKLKTTGNMTLGEIVNTIIERLDE